MTILSKSLHLLCLQHAVGRVQIYLQLIFGFFLQFLIFVFRGPDSISKWMRHYPRPLKPSLYSFCLSHCPSCLQGKDVQDLRKEDYRICAERIDHQESNRNESPKKSYEHVLLMCRACCSKFHNLLCIYCQSTASKNLFSEPYQKMPLPKELECFLLVLKQGAPIERTVYFRTNAAQSSLLEYFHKRTQKPADWLKTFYRLGITPILLHPVFRVPQSTANTLYRVIYQPFSKTFLSACSKDLFSWLSIPIRAFTFRANTRNYRLSRNPDVSTLKASPRWKIAAFNIDFGFHLL